MEAIQDNSTAFQPAQLGQTASVPTPAGEAAGQEAALPVSTSGEGAFPTVTEIISQPLVRKSLPAILAVLVLAGFALVFLWVDDGEYRALYPGMSDLDRGEAFEALNAAGIDARIDNSTGSITVPLDRYYEARMALASAGLPREASSSAMDYFNNQSSMTTSQFMEQARYAAVIENELVKSIAQIASIQSARVHLATPRQSAFIRNRTPTKASVVVVPYAGRSISPGQVQAITHLVASSVPYLAASDVSVVNQQGDLLTNTMSPLLNEASMQSSFERSVEENYRERIESLLAPMVGMDNVRADVDVLLDFTELETTIEDYDQNDQGPQTRSEVLIEDRTDALNSAGVPGAPSNVVPENTDLAEADAAEFGAGGGGNDGVRSSRTTRNYELDRSIRYVRNQPGSLTRLSIAVVINEQAFTDPEAEETAPGAGDIEELRAELTELVRSAVGFDAGRGDSVTVITAPFRPEQEIRTLTPWYEDSAILSLIKYGTGVFAFLIIALFVMRPVIKLYLPEKESEAEERAKALADGELSEEELEMISLGEGESLEEIKSKLKPKKSTISADMLDTANTYDDKVALIRLLVAEDSGRVANVLKKMIKPV
ncbi:unnamed protein product [Discosporangium mesarthrocarpum]